LMSAAHFGKLFLSLVADVFTVGLSDWLPICPLLFNASGRFVATGILLPQKAWYREHVPGLQQTTEGFSVFQFASQIKQWEQGSLAMLYSWHVADAEVLRGSAVWNPDSEAARDPERSHAIHTSPHCVVQSFRETGQTQQKST
jgi:hypothetical protein